MMVAALLATAPALGQSPSRSSASITIFASVAPQVRIAGTAASPCVALNTASRSYAVLAAPGGYEPASCGGSTRIFSQARISPDTLIIAPE